MQVKHNGFHSFWQEGAPRRGTQTKQVFHVATDDGLRTVQTTFELEVQKIFPHREYHGNPEKLQSIVVSRKGPLGA